VDEDDEPETDHGSDEGDSHDDAPGALHKAAGLVRSAASGAVSYVSDRRFGRTPAGKARQAAEEGAKTFHIRLDLDSIAHRSDGHSTHEPELDDAIGAIEAEGWRLDQIQYITETDDWEKTDDQGRVSHGSEQRTSAVLLFRSE
jgi:hypothetical protein